MRHLFTTTPGELRGLIKRVSWAARRPHRDDYDYRPQFRRVRLIGTPGQPLHAGATDGIMLAQARGPLVETAFTLHVLPDEALAALKSLPRHASLTVHLSDDKTLLRLNRGAQDIGNLDVAQPLSFDSVLRVNDKILATGHPRYSVGASALRALLPKRGYVEIGCGAGGLSVETLPYLGRKWVTPELTDLEQAGVDWTQPQALACPTEGGGITYYSAERLGALLDANQGRTLFLRQCMHSRNKTWAQAPFNYGALIAADAETGEEVAALMPVHPGGDWIKKAA